MTEEEWLANDDPAAMLRLLRKRLSRRKLRLFIGEALIVAWRRVGAFTTEEWTSILAAVEPWVNGAPKVPLPGNSPLHLLLSGIPVPYFDFGRLIWDEDWLDAHRLASHSLPVDSQQFPALLRDITGNPFRPGAFAPEWRTDTAVSLARTMYESREFSAMQILADALQDAGCDNADILDHCRDPHATHVRGCWVVDLVLSKQ